MAPAPLPLRVTHLPSMSLTKVWLSAIHRNASLASHPRTPGLGTGLHPCPAITGAPSAVLHDGIYVCNFASENNGSCSREYYSSTYGHNKAINCSMLTSEYVMQENNTTYINEYTHTCQHPGPFAALCIAVIEPSALKLQI